MVSSVKVNSDSSYIIWYKKYNSRYVTEDGDPISGKENIDNKEIIQIFEKKGKIEVLKIEHIYEYLNKYNLSNKDILFVGHKSSSINSNIFNIKISESVSQYPKAIWIGKLALHLIKRFEMTDSKDIAFDKVEPIYVRLPEINKKI